MRTKLFTVLFLVILAISGLILNSFKVSENTKSQELATASPVPTPTQNIWLQKFYIGAIDCDVAWRGEVPYSNLHQLGLNVWHSYLRGRKTGNIWYPKMLWYANENFSDDYVLSQLSEYQGIVNPYIESIYNTNGLTLMTQRPKITWLCYGQRSDYKCSDIVEDPELWFYHFQEQGHTTGQNIIDNSTFGNGIKVRYCSTIPSYGDNAGLIVSRLKANTEQSHRNNSDTEFGNPWLFDSQCNWIIKPSIRIPADFPINNQETPVCSIKVKKQNGSEVETIIKAKYFLDDQSLYDGSYKEEYNFGGEQNTLKFSGDWGDFCMYNARGNHTVSEEQSDPYINHADIQVYWYGNCDMWIDYVRVDNDVANRLLKLGGDPEFDQWITDEAQYIGKDQIMKYYLELAEFNNIPCIAYVNSKLHSIPNCNVDLMQDFTNMLFWHVPKENISSVTNPEFIYHQYIQKAGFNQFFGECYPFNACTGNQHFSKVPNTLPKIQYPPYDSILAESVSPAIYEEYLQDNLNHLPPSLENVNYDIKCDEGNEESQDLGFFRFKMQLGDAVSKLSDKPFIFMPQIHQGCELWETKREPTNEELEMTVNISLTYGVKGILFYNYGTSNDETGYGLGLIKPGDLTQLRDHNVYWQGHAPGGQHSASYNTYNKYEIIQDITDRLKNKWGGYLLSFNNIDRHSYIYTSERNNLINNTYFTDVYTYLPNPVNPSLPDSPPEEPANRFLQIGTFINSNEIYNKYFMIVNRRCSPYYDINGDYGGGRYVKVQFDANAYAFNNFNNWKIIDVKNDSTIYIFDKNNSDLILLGWYMPGEGRLYKIASVMQEGGTFVCDEGFSCSVNCKGNVYNNGKNLTIGNGAYVYFADTATIYMNGGIFKSGEYGDNIPHNVYFNKAGANRWPGLYFDTCSLVEIYTSNFLNIQQNSFAVNLTNCIRYKISNNNFTFTSNENCGGIFAYFSQNSNLENSENIYQIISGNEFQINESSSPCIEMTAHAAISLPTNIEYNHFNYANNLHSSTAIYMEGISGGTISNNCFDNFDYGILLLSSNCSLYKNNITNTVDNTIGVDNILSSNNLGTSYVYLTGGSNYIAGTGNNSINIHTVDSYFDIDNGYNTFNINFSSSQYHIDGWFDSSAHDSYYARENCFLDNSISGTPRINVTKGQNGNPITFYTDPTNCIPSSPGDYDIYSIGGGIYDTLFIRSGGSGGGLSDFQLSKHNSHLIKQKQEISNEMMEIQSTYKNLKDSINICIRKRNFIIAEQKCFNLLSTYPDSLFSIGVISNLYIFITS